ncbi:MAG: hypothetical protein HY074_05745 [Deltaproteobacteria bacterium]|nr:hypothetical protein [Deltaproteobacteria bacterium]
MRLDKPEVDKRETEVGEHRGQETKTERQLHIFVNRQKFDKNQNVKSHMTVDEIAQLVGLTAETAVVRRSNDERNDHGSPLSGTVEVEDCEQFLVVRKAVKGGHGHEEKKLEPLHIFVNRQRFDESQGVKPHMTVDEIARLVGLTAETAVVRRSNDAVDDHSPPLSGTLEVEDCDQFLVVRKAVKGGHGNGSRIEAELALLRGSGQVVEYVPGPPGVVIYKALPVTGQRSPLASTDVMVPVSPGFPAAMLDRAALPADSPLLGRVRGAVQEEIVVGGRRWKLVSYHPHNGGGAEPWNPQVHGFHSYIREVLSWLGDLQ